MALSNARKLVNNHIEGSSAKLKTARTMKSPTQAENGKAYVNPNRA